jgi:hypothetical protein
MKAILTFLAAALTALAIAIPGSAAEDSTTGATESGSQSETYVPFVTDFPHSAPEAAPPLVAAGGNEGFDGLDAALGATVGLALGALAAASLPPLRRRRSVSSA